jgi:hypothetical protein
MDQDSSAKLMASLHETHLKRTKNLQQLKWQWQPQQLAQQRLWRLLLMPLPAAASLNKPCYSLD